MKGKYAAAAVIAISGVSAQVEYPSVTTTTTTTTPIVVHSPPATTSSPSSASTTSIAVVSSPVTSASSQSYVTVAYDDCPSPSVPTLITVTNGFTVKYCPECQNRLVTSALSSNGVAHTTVYTTTYMSLCSTGLTPQAYTVTESCTNATPTWATHSTAIPPGFTFTTKTCSESTSVPVTITEPCGCEATSGVPATQIAAMTTPAPASSSPTGGATTQISDGHIQAPASWAPYPTSADSKCPGPQCRTIASGGMPGANTTSITPDIGAASRLSTGVICSMVFAILSGLVVFAL